MIQLLNNVLERQAYTEDIYDLSVGDSICPMCEKQLLSAADYHTL